MRLHFLEAIGSFFIIGLGQIIKGDNQKGILLLLIFYFLLPTIVYLTLMISGYAFLYVLGFAIIFGIILWLYNIWDAAVR